VEEGEAEANQQVSQSVVTSSRHNNTHNTRRRPAMTTHQTDHNNKNTPTQKGVHAGHSIDNVVEARESRAASREEKKETMTG